MRQQYLEGEKIFLSPVEETDVSAIQEIKNSKFVRKYMSSSLPKTNEDVLKEIKKMKENESPYFLIFEKNSEKLVGFVILEVLSNIIRASELHIGIEFEYANKGYGKETISLITRYAFEVLNIHSIRALIRENNERSLKCFESQGYKRVGCLPEWSFYDGGYHDCYILDCIPSFLK